MFEDILNPVDDNLLKLSKLLSDQVIGKNILVNSKSSGFPDIKDVSIANSLIRKMSTDKPLSKNVLKYLIKSLKVLKKSPDHTEVYKIFKD